MGEVKTTGQLAAKAENIAIADEVVMPMETGHGVIMTYRWGRFDEGPDVIYSHANGFSARSYRKIFEPLAQQGLSILAYDLRGHGRTCLPANPQLLRNWDLYAHDLSWLVEQVAQRPVMLSGHSMGGTISLMALREIAQHVKAMTLFDPVLLPRALRLMMTMPGSRLLARRQAMVRSAIARREQFGSFAHAIDHYSQKKHFQRWSKDMLADYVMDAFEERQDGKIWLRCNPRWEAANFMSQPRHPLRYASKLKGQLRAYIAEHDTTLLAKSELKRKLPQTQIERIAGGSHLFPFEQPGLCIAILAKSYAACQ